MAELEKSSIRPNNILIQRFSRRDILRAASLGLPARALASLALSEKNKFGDRLQEDSVRSDLKDLLVPQESLEENWIYPYASADVVDNQGFVSRHYAISGSALYSSHWDANTRKYTEYSSSGILPIENHTALIALPDDKTVFVAGGDNERNIISPRSSIAVSHDQGINFTDKHILSDEKSVIWDGKLIEGTEKALFQEYVNGLGVRYVLFDTLSGNYDTLQTDTLHDKEGNVMLSLLPTLDNIYVDPEKRSIIVDGVIYDFDAFPEYHQGSLSVAAIGHASIDLDAGVLESVTYTQPTFTEPRSVSFERDEDSELTKMYITASYPKRGMHIVDVPSDKVIEVPFEPFDNRLRETYGNGDWEARFIRMQRIRGTYIATGLAVHHQTIDGQDYLFDRAVTAFWPSQADPVTNQDSIQVRVIDTGPIEMDLAEASVVASAREKRLHGGNVLEEIIPHFGFANIPIDRTGMPLGEEILFPNKGLQQS